ncbi:MAG: hypothetical protein AB1437_01680 [Pseudomonadota bacterium]
MSVFSAPVFDATVVYEGQELFKGRGAAQTWAEKVAKELETEVTVEKIGTGWVLKATVDGEPRSWGIFGQRLSRIEQAG